MPKIDTPRAAFEIEVPASTSNIGPGFDCLGLALDLFNTFRVKRISGPENQLTGLGTCSDLKAENNLFFRAMNAAARRIGKPCPSILVEIDGNVPQSRGLGSSSTAIIAGVLCAKNLLNSALSNEELLPLMIELEGHPDNVTASLMGSLTATAMTDAGPIYNRYLMHHSWRVILLIPDYELSTVKARSAIPSTVSHADAIANLTRIPLLVEALRSGQRDSLRHLITDRLHEPYRKELIVGYDTIREAAFEAGADGFFISGAGPTLAALLARGDAREIIKAMQNAASKAGVNATVLCLNPYRHGTRVRQLRG